MKHIIIILILALAPFFAHSKEKDSLLIAENIQYAISIDNNKYCSQPPWWNENIEASKREIFFNMLMKNIYEGKIKAYDIPEQDSMISHKILSIKEVDERLHGGDTLTMTCPYPPYDEYDVVIYRTFNPFYCIRNLKFLEEWYFNTETFQIEKKIKGICPVIEKKWDYISDKPLTAPLFWIYFDDNDSIKNNKILAQRIMYDVPVNFRKNEDYCDYSIDWWNNNIENSKREFLINLLMNGVYSGRIKACSFLSDTGNVKSGKILTIEEIKKLFTKTDTINIGELNGPGIIIPELINSLDTVAVDPSTNNIDTILTRQLSPVKMIDYITFKEDWYVDPNTCQIKKKVKAICPILTVDDNEGNITEKKPLFWINFNDNINNNKTLITEKIYYELNLQNSDGKENFSDERLNEFIKMVKNAICKGKLQPYIDDKPLDVKCKNEDIILSHIDSVCPHIACGDFSKEASIEKIHFEKADRVGFYETWYIDPKTLQIEKEVDSMSFLVKRYNEENKFTGFDWLFEIYFNNKYHEKE